MDTTTTNFTTEKLTNKHPFRQWLEWQIPNTHWKMKGYSRSGDKTFFYIPQLDICLDAALAEGNQAKHVFVTHTHNDHIADIEYLSSKRDVEIYLPKSSVSYLEKYILVRRELNHSAPYNPELRGNCSIKGIEKNDVVFFGKHDNYKVEIAECFHRIDCVGYAFSEKSRRLKAEYETIKQEYLAKNEMPEFGKFLAEKKKTEEVEEWIYEPKFAFLGDTTERVFEENSFLLNYPVIFTECTFLTDEHFEYAAERGHSHWQNLKSIIKANSNIIFVLIHFSLRYSDAEIIEFFNQELIQNEISNVKIWVSESSLLPAQHQKS